MQIFKSLESDVLLGVLAVQLDFVTHPQLSEAMSQLLRDKSQSLAALLVQRKLISAADEKLLQALVQRNVALHNHDPSLSLQSAGAERTLSRIISALDDEKLRDRLSPLISQQDVGEQTTASVQVGESSSKSGRYCVLRPHARGGLGEILVARDDELHREVALKRLLPWRADNADSRARFVLEAEITGRLEHPGIVPVYGLGHDETGRPFYAMRLIQGESLKDRIRLFHETAGGRSFLVGGQAVEFRRMLGHFIDVCQAISFAHDRGVLHRDIKPGNVMLGKYGETLVVDWGLAKVGSMQDGDSPDSERALRPHSGSSHAETAMGSAVGTPEFMSPEQAAGRLDELDGRSDVYGLGATLYVILTGRPPFRRESDDVLQKVERGDFDPPDRVRSGLPQPLVSICMRAMQRRPQDRYASPRELAHDVEHCLADEPVSAHSESWVERGNRIYRRHRTLALVVSLFLLLITVGLIIATSMYGVQNARLREANVRVQHSSTSARQLATRILDTAEQVLSKVPNQVANRIELTREAVTGFDELGKLDPRNTNIQMDRAKSRLKLANLLKITNLKQEAKVEYETCIRSLECLLDHPEHGEIARGDLVEALIYFASYLRSDGQLPAAKRQLERAKPILESISDQESLSFQWSRARYEADFGSLLYEVGRVREAAKLRKAAAAAYKSLIIDAGFASETYLYLTELDGYATALVFLGDLEMAEQVYNEAVNVSDVREEQDSARDNRNMAALVRLGRGRLRLQKNAQDPGGAKDLHDALKRWEVLAQEFSTYLKYKRHAAQAKIVLADSLIANGELGVAANYISEAYVELKKAIDKYHLFSWKPDLADALAMKSRLAAAHGDWERSRAHLVSAMELQEEIVAINQDSTVQAQRLDRLRAQLSAESRPGNAESAFPDDR